MTKQRSQSQCRVRVNTRRGWLLISLLQNTKALDDRQGETAEQQWLMEHCWEYGFILRYPPEKADVTGIIFEPWHYRYVGEAAAKEIHDQDITLEEYLGE